MSNFRTLMKVCCAAVMTLGLAACGGGGSSEQTMVPEADPGPGPALGMAQMAAMDAADAAKAASGSAAVAVAEVGAIQDADVSSYTLARIAADEAMVASAAAKVASDAAQATMDTAEAEMYQAAAEARQSEAEAAYAETMELAGAVSMAHAEAMAAAAAAAAEAMALSEARGAASAAAYAAMTASDSAAAAVAAVEASQGADVPSYTRAQDAATAAMDAYMAAKAASDAAASAATSAEAAEHQATAEAKQGEAETALATATMQAGLVEMAQQELDDAAAEAMALSNAQTEAMDAAAAARVAANEARAAAVKVAELAGADSQQAMDANAAATAATVAAILAENASERAQAATTSELAMAEQARAEAQLETAQMQQIAAAGLEVAAQGVADEMMALSDAQTAAMEAAVAARTAATDAREAADTIAVLLGAGTDGAMEAAAAATRAEVAAVAAEMASANAQAAVTSAAAMDGQMAAETEQGNAEVELAAVAIARDDAQAANDAALDVQERRDLLVAQTAAEIAAAAASVHHGIAMDKATAARTQATAASASANRAMRARTDYDAASTQATAAATAAGLAEAAERTASTAKDAAAAASAAALAATMSAVAQVEREKAATARTTAAAQQAVANTQYMAAKAAASSAAAASDRHVLELFTMANAYHIDTALSPGAEESGGEQDRVTENKKANRAAVHTAISMAAPGNQQAPTTSSVEAVWPYNTDPFAADGVDEVAGNADDPEPGQGLLAVTVTVGEEPLVTTRTAPGEDEELGTPDDIPANFNQEERGLGSFDMFQLSSGDSGTGGDFTSGVRAIAFTDKMQATAPTDAMSVSVNNVTVPNSNYDRITTAAAALLSGADRNDFTGMFDHDGNPATMALDGIFDCVDPNVCRLERTGTAANGDNEADTKITAIVGYKFHGTGVTPAAPSVEDMNYIAFGIWLDEDAPAAESDLHGYTFGAYHGGGTIMDEGVMELIGQATYKGSAAGVRSSATEVDFFSADATLTAEFGAVDALGKITGRIHNIVAGGDSVSDPIHLSLLDQDAGDTPEASNIVAGGTFGGRAWMGTGTLAEDGDGEYDRLRTGTWTGAFYSNMIGAETTANGSVAGTFGVSDNADEATTNVDSYVGAFGAHCNTGSCK